jgi:hypothetical protein
MSFGKGFHLLLSMPLNLNATQVTYHLVAPDNHLDHKNASLDSMTIYPKLDQALPHWTLDQWNEMPYKYTFALCFPFHLLDGDATQASNLHHNIMLNNGHP